MRAATSPIRLFNLGFLGLVAGGTVACAPQPAPKAEAIDPVARGRTLVTVGGCNDCHSPKIFTAAGPVPDTTRLLSGHPAGSKLPAVPAGVIGPEQWGAITSNDFTAWAGPWGVSFTANLTPDASGLAAYTPEIFIQTIRTGKHAGVGRPILPPMPWPYYATLSDDDLRAIFAYLRSLPPISNSVPAPLPPGGGGR